MVLLCSCGVRPKLVEQVKKDKLNTDLHVEFLNKQKKDVTSEFKKQEVKTNKINLIRVDDTSKNYLNDEYNYSQENDEVYGDEDKSSVLDSSNPIVQYAQSLVGQPGLCDDIANKMIYFMFAKEQIWINFEKVQVTKQQAQIGDIILYDYNPELGYGHIAIYLGNGMALHGNMASANHTAIIASVDVGNLQNPKFYHLIDRSDFNDSQSTLNEAQESIHTLYQDSIYTKEECALDWNHLTDEEFERNKNLFSFCNDMGFID